MAARPIGAVDQGASWQLRTTSAVLPDTESLETTLLRVQPYWEGEIAPKLSAGETLGCVPLNSSVSFSSQFQCSSVFSRSFK